MSSFKEFLLLVTLTVHGTVAYPTQQDHIRFDRISSRSSLTTQYPPPLLTHHTLPPSSLNTLYPTLTPPLPFPTPQTHLYILTLCLLLSFKNLYPPHPSPYPSLPSPKLSTLLPCTP